MSNGPVESGPPDPTNPKFQKPFIDGIEVTQGIQYYKADQHLTDPNDRDKDNSVMLIANKPAWVRVYVHDLSGSGRNITGELIVARNWQFPPVWDQRVLAPLAPSTVPALMNFDYATERSNILSTLNFVIPQKVMSYNVRLIANIWQQEGGNKNNPDDTYSLFLIIMRRKTLKLRGIMISYSGPDPNSTTTPPPTINLNAPTIADLQNAAGRTLTTDPVQSQAIFSSAGTMQWGTPLTGEATSTGGCSTEWEALTASAAQVKMNDGNRTDVIYYGLLPVGTPIGFVSGCALNGVSIGLNGDQFAMIHEIGHAAGLAHSPCGLDNGDSNYPAYEPYDPSNTPQASLGEYGLNINNGDIHLPDEKDYMSYCNQDWISLYHQKKLTDNDNLNPEQLELSKSDIPVLVDPYLWPWEYIPDPPGQEPNLKPQKVISIVGLYNKEREIEVHSVMRIFALPTINDAVKTNYLVTLWGNRGEILAQAPIMRLKTHGHGCGSNEEKNSTNYNKSFAFQALLPDVAPGSLLNIVKRRNDDDDEGSDVEVWSRSAPDVLPKIESFWVEVSEEKIVALWKGQFSSRYGTRFSLQFSKDEGRSWNSLAVGIEKSLYEFDLKSIPSGNIVFRLYAHDGFFTSHLESDYFQIADHYPIISILHPQESSTLVSGMPMRLWAVINTSTNPGLKINKYTWKIDDDEILDAYDIDTWITAPAQGNHKCTLLVEHEIGESMVTTQFTTINSNR